MEALVMQSIEMRLRRKCYLFWLLFGCFGIIVLAIKDSLAQNEPISEESSVTVTLVYCHPLRDQILATGLGLVGPLQK